MTAHGPGDATLYGMAADSLEAAFPAIRIEAERRAWLLPTLKRKQLMMTGGVEFYGRCYPLEGLATGFPGDLFWLR